MTPRVLESREYKLLLNCDAFKGDPLAAAAAFWEAHLGSAIGASPSLQVKQSFGNPELRSTSFWDTPNRDLKSLGLTLRERIKIKSGKPENERKLSLKLRTPDLVFTAMADFRVLKGEDPQLEEDIAPLAIKKDGAVVFAKPPSAYSRFSLSSTLKLKKEEMPKTLEDLVGLYPGLDSELSGAAGGTALAKGAQIDETTLEGAKIDLGENCEADFTLTLWRFPKSEGLDIAELSFRCMLEKGEMPPSAAKQALGLFLRLQDVLSGFINQRETSKTELALP